MERNLDNSNAFPKLIQISSSLLVVREREGPDARVAGGVGVEEGQVEGPPDLDHAAVAARHQVLPVARQQDALWRERKKDFFV